MILLQMTFLVLESLKEDQDHIEELFMTFS